MKVLVTQHMHTGHRLMYVRVLVSKISVIGGDPHVALSREAVRSSEFALHLGDVRSKFKLHVVDDQSLAKLEHLARLHTITKTVILEGDKYQIPAAVRGWSSGNLVLLIMRPASQTHHWWKLPFARKCAKATIRFAALHRRNVEVFKLTSATAARVSKREVRDPVFLAGSTVDHQAVLEALGISSVRTWFGILGSISARKNVDVVMRAARSLEAGRYGLVLAGKIDDTLDRASIMSEAAALEELGFKVKVVDRLLTDIELDALVSLLDCLVLAHSNEGSSGILGKASLAGTFVLAAGAESLKNDLQEISAGVWVPLEETTIADAMRNVSKRINTSGRRDARDHADGFMKVLSGVRVPRS